MCVHSVDPPRTVERTPEVMVCECWSLSAHAHESGLERGRARYRGAAPAQVVELSDLRLTFGAEHPIDPLTPPEVEQSEPLAARDGVSHRPCVVCLAAARARPLDRERAETGDDRRRPHGALAPPSKAADRLPRCGLRGNRPKPLGGALGAAGFELRYVGFGVAELGVD